MVASLKEVQGISRVLYDLTSKPPGTTEWEWSQDWSTMRQYLLSSYLWFDTQTTPKCWPLRLVCMALLEAKLNRRVNCSNRCLEKGTSWQNCIVYLTGLLAVGRAKNKNSTQKFVIPHKWQLYCALWTFAVTDVHKIIEYSTFQPVRVNHRLASQSPKKDLHDDLVESMLESVFFEDFENYRPFFCCQFWKNRISLVESPHIWQGFH